MGNASNTIIAEYVSRGKEKVEDSVNYRLHGEKSHPYRAYLLRCWREGGVAPGKEPVWRFSVEEIGTERQRKGFSSLEPLTAFLRAELAGGEGESS